MLNRTDIDWSGYGVIETSSAPVPVIAKNSAEYCAILTALQHLEMALKPAEPRQILAVLGLLRLHKPAVNLDENQMKKKLYAYLEDLGEYPIDLIADACRTYRRSPEKEDKFFPETSQLRALIIPKFYERSAYFYRLKIMKNKADQKKDNEISEKEKSENRERLQQLFAKLSQELGN